MNIATRRILFSLTISFSVLSFAQKPAPRKPAARAAATKPSSWVVKPEWVHADEGFLAGDALQGRGSGTRDEWIAAEFVAAQFESFGLKPAAPDKSFIEKVELITPKLDGKSQVAAGDATYNEAQDFYLMTSSGDSVSGKLQKIAAADIGKTPIAPGAAVLVSGIPEEPQIGRAHV